MSATAQTFPRGGFSATARISSGRSFRCLFGLIGTTYGAADKFTFKVPDYRGFFLRGFDPGGQTDKGAPQRHPGNALGSSQAEDVLSHAHLFGNNTLGSPASALTAGAGPLPPSGSNGYQPGGASGQIGLVNFAGEHMSHANAPVIGAETRPINMAVNLHPVCRQLAG
jgi:microcystin-dependent protein